MASSTRARSASVCNRPRHHKPAFDSARYAPASSARPLPRCLRSSLRLATPRRRPRAVQLGWRPRRQGKGLRPRCGTQPRPQQRRTPGVGGAGRKPWSDCFRCTRAGRNPPACREHCRARHAHRLGHPAQAHPRRRRPRMSLRGAPPCDSADHRARSRRRYPDLAPSSSGGATDLQGSLPRLLRPGSGLTRASASRGNSAPRAAPRLTPLE
jgi:hypothetical protein